jgi:hypothetical protein
LPSLDFALVTEEVRETKEIQLTEQEVEAEFKRLKAAQSKRGKETKSVPKGSKGKALPGKKKQASLMSFFKK